MKSPCLLLLLLLFQATFTPQFLAAAAIEKRESAESVAAEAPKQQASLLNIEGSVDKLLKGRVDEASSGVAVLVARDGRILYEKAFGSADLERGLAATPETIFRIGSVTKQFTAAAILHLQEAGKLKISDPLSKYYPDFPGGEGISLERLLTHTSGLHSYTDSPAFLQGVTRPTTTKEVIASIKQLPPDFKPGERWAYCNSGYFLLGDIIEKVSGRSYGDYLQDAFFRPLGMKSSGVYRNDQPPEGAAVGQSYSDGKFGRALDWDMSWAGAAGALYSTVGDLHRWNEGVFGGKVLGSDSLKAALTAVVTAENKGEKGGAGYGYGWGIRQFRGVREVSHGGGLHGFLSNLLRVPERNFTVAVLTNGSPSKPGTDPSALSREIVELYLGAELAPDVKPVALEATTISEAALERIVGRYDYRGPVLVVTREGQRVFAQLGGQRRNEIFPASETEFFWKIVDARVEFVRDASGKVEKAIHRQGGQTIHASRLAPIPEIPLDDAQSDLLLGDYDFPPVGKATVSRADGRLYGQITGQPKMEMGAISATELFLRTSNARVTFLKDDDGRITKLILHQGGQSVEMPKLIQP